MIIEEPDLSIRPETEADSAFLKQLYRSTREDLAQLGLPEPMLENLIEMQFRAQRTGYRNQFPNAGHSIIEKNGEPVGCLVTDHGDDEIRLVYIALLPAARNCGNGRRLLRALQGQARANNKAIGLSVDPMNGPARHLYAALGFEVVKPDGANLEMVWRS